MKLKRMRFNLRFPDPRGGGNFVTIHSVKELRDGLMERIIACDDLFDYFKSGHPLNAGSVELPMFVTELGIVISVSPVQL